MRPFLLGAALLLGACNPAPKADTELAISAMKMLSDDTMQGREANTQGADRARLYIGSAVEALAGRSPKRDNFSTLLGEEGDPPIDGTNLYFDIAGATPGEGPVLEITAHYDHLGVRDGKIYNGADDNASGAAALLSIAKSFLEDRPEHDVRIIWFDAEEKGLTGARVWVMQIDDGRPRVNLNLDMISQNEDGEIYAAGTYHTPALRPVVEAAAKGTGLDVRFGHDRPEDGAGDWTSQSDHGVYHARGVPFVYLGVEDHPHYHAPTDTFETIPLDTYRGAVQLAVNVAHGLDNDLDALAKPLTTD